MVSTPDCCALACRPVALLTTGAELQEDTQVCSTGSAVSSAVNVALFAAALWASVSSAGHLPVVASVRHGDAD